MTGSPSAWVRLFASMWALAHIIHLWNFSGGKLGTVTGVLTFLAALAVLLRPGDHRRLLVLAAAQIADVVWELPLAPDHWHLAAVGNLILLVGAAVGRGVEELSGSLRAALVIGYGAAALAKWNDTFFDAAHSCAVFIASEASFGLTDGVDLLDPFFIVLSVGSETAIAIGLAIPRTRRWAAAYGIGFHLLVALSPAIGVADFSAFLYALFFLCLPLATTEAAIDWLRMRAAASPIVHWIQRRRWPAVAGLFVAGRFSGYLGLSDVLLWAVATFYGAGLLASVVAGWRQGSVRRLRLAAPALPAIVLILVIASSPYLGYRTTGVFTMFSNLRTEGPASNHFFMPSIHLTDLQNDLAVLIEASDGSLAAWAEAGQSIPISGIAQRVHADPTLVVTASYREEVSTYGPSGAGIARPGLIERKLLNFRAVPVSVDPICQG